MRALRLDLSVGAIDLHPFMTVARGLTPALRTELVDVLAGIPSGRAPVGGLVEAHGVLLDLTAENLALLDLDAPLPVVVTADDLPGALAAEAPDVAEARARVRATEEALAEAEAEVERIEASLQGAQYALAAARGEQVVGADSGLADRRAAVAAAEAALAGAQRDEQEAADALAAAEKAVLETELLANETREVRAAATRAISVAAAALDAAADRRDPVAVAAVETAKERVAEAEAVVARARARARPDDAEDAGTAVEVDRRAPGHDGVGVEVLRAERLEVEAAVLALETPDPFPVRLALEQIGAGAPVEMVAPPEAIVLADRWAAISAELDVLTGAGADRRQGDRRAEALKRMQAAEAEVEAAEVGDRPGVEPAAVHVLEAAHNEVLAARDAADRRIGARQARKRLDEAVAREQTVLDQLGFLTYAEYLMGVSGSQDVLQDPNRLAKAREELAAARQGMRQLDDDVADDLRRAELLAQRRALRSAAVDLLGSDPPDDVEGALRRHRVRAEGTGGSSQLAQALEAAGLVIDEEDLPERFLVDLAKVWLDEQDLVSNQRRHLEARVAELDARLAEVQRFRPEAEEDDRPALTQAVADLEEERSALRNAEARASRHAKSEAEVEERRLAFEAAANGEAAAVVAVGQAEADIVRVDDARRRTARELEAARANVTRAAETVGQLIDVLATLEAQVEAAASTGLRELEEESAQWEAALATARTVVAERTRLAGEARATLAVREAESQVSGPTASEEQVERAVEDTEWYLLARLAAQRAASYCGSVPLVLDDALAQLDAASTRELLDRLERMAATVQLVVVTEDLPAAAWASQLGPERAAVVELG